MKALFVAAGPYTWGSSRMRAYWPSEHMTLDTEVVEYREIERTQQLPSEADVVIWQKTADRELIAQSLDRIHILDVCDPSWWWQPEQCREILDRVQAVVCSTEMLRNDLLGWWNHSAGHVAWVIPDRIDLSHFTKRRRHVNQTPIRFIWYGFSANRMGLFAALANLERLVANHYAIELTICDDRPQDIWQITEDFPIYHVAWSLERENDILASHDVALLPPYPGPWGRVKSNNRLLTAWACGLPATDGQSYEELASLMDAETRTLFARRGRDVLERDYLIERSARAWEALLAQVRRDASGAPYVEKARGVPCP